MNLMKKIAADKSLLRNLVPNLNHLGEGIGTIGKAIPGAFNKVNEYMGDAYKGSDGNPIKTFGNKVGDIKGKALNWALTPFFGKGHNTFKTNHFMTNGQMWSKNVKDVNGMVRGITGNTFANNAVKTLAQDPYAGYDVYGRPMNARGV